MKPYSLLLLTSVVGAVPQLLPELKQGADCKALPSSVKLGPGIAMRAEDIPSGCADFEVLVARGTSEPNYAEGGKFGVVVGDPIVSNLTKVIPTARGYPVQYPASANISGVTVGGKDVVARLEKQAKECPNAKFALVGYSQGAAVMHAAAKNIVPELQSKIVALVMFGDPSLRSGQKFPPSLESKLLENCAEGDMVCDKGNCFYPHLTYMRKEWVDKTVKFLSAAYSGKPLPAKPVGIGLDNVV